MKQPDSYQWLACYCEMISFLHDFGRTCGINYKEIITK